ncbi:S8 family serine peptidase [Hydrogenivirga sp. 128-5-R1-1]|uniref:S8 family serine peptidase n=1 Tax=Hydrogenivirga sp. 128-5-R1-1 TaxID=392423 RepID=UPI00015F0C6E|nr:S8 family serine peptidase [Hydrogenivirga sp. 128-5-R1-1]EDP75920.1 serine protease [Hydrogenivirga sp. 128-5-R1-1]
MVWALVLTLACTLSFGAEFLVRTEDPSKVPGKVIKRIDDKTYIVRIDEGVSVGLLSHAEGVLIEKNYRLRALQTPNDPCLSYRWDLDFIGAYSAWDLSTGSGSVYVAVLDTGVDYNHPDLKDNLWKNPGEICTDGVDNDGNGYVDDCYGVNILCYPEGKYDPKAQGCNKPDAMDDNGHGTSVASIVGAVGNNGTLITGVNWQVKIVPCKFLDSSGGGTIAGEIECLNYILDLKRNKGLNIIAVNASYGEVYPDSQVQRDKIEELANEGILYVTAAGNSNLNNDEVSMNPCNYDLGNMLCVGSVGSKGERSSFSNYGFNKVKLSAPGESIWTLKNGSAGTSCTDLSLTYGTSMSTPFVSGAVALLKSYQPSLNYTQIRERIITTGRNYMSLAGKTYSCNVLSLDSLLLNSSSPKVCPSSLSISWGSVEGCESSSREFTLRNTGNGVVQVTSVRVEGSGFYLSKDDCSGRSLNTFEECRVYLSFSPAGAGDYSGRLLVSFSDSGLNFSVSLSAKSESSCGSGGCSTGGVAHSLLPLLGLLVILSRLKRRW